MARKRKTKFKLNPEWMFQEPIDFEFNKYSLLNYNQKCEQSFDSFKIYPDFVECGNLWEECWRILFVLAWYGMCGWARLG